MSPNRWSRALVLGCIVLPILAACGGAAAPAATTAPTATVATSAQAQPTTAAPATATKAPPTATVVPPTATPPGPAVGGTLVIGMSAEPDTLDVQKSAMTAMEVVMSQVGATLITRDPATGKLVPYLAESWSISADGLTVGFVLKKGMKFHDGSPVTAADYAWTLNRAIDPTTRSLGTGAMLTALSSAEAVDDANLRLKLKTPSFPLLSNLAFVGYCSVLPRAAVEKLGDQFGRQPIGAGPFKFKEWKTGERIVLERNPDYKWGPAFTKGGPWLQTIEYRIVPEYATAMAGVEAGEIGFYTGILPKDVQRVKDMARFQIYEAVLAGASPYVQLNLSKPPLDDLKVRKALAAAIDRQAFIKAIASGSALEQRGPLSLTIAGYWPGIETVGFGFDLAQAKSWLKEAGYTADSNGMLQKGGQALKFTLSTLARDDRVRVAEILKEQWKALGVDIAIQQMEAATSVADVITGKFEICVFGYTHTEADILAIVFGGSKVGGANMSKVDDPELDNLLLATRSTTDPDKRQGIVNAVATRLVEQVYMIGLYAPKSFSCMSNSIKGAVYSPVTLQLWLNDAYVSGK